MMEAPASFALHPLLRQGEGDGRMEVPPLGEFYPKGGKG